MQVFRPSDKVFAKIMFRRIHTLMGSPGPTLGPNRGLLHLVLILCWQAWQRIRDVLLLHGLAGFSQRCDAPSKELGKGQVSNHLCVLKPMLPLVSKPNT